MAPVTLATQEIRYQACGPLSLPATGVGYCSQMCDHHLSCSRQVGRGAPLGRDHSLALCCDQSASLILRGQTKLDPLLGTDPGNSTGWISCRPFLDIRVCPTPTYLFGGLSPSVV